MGFDYGLGKTNIDLETGIRFGIIPIHDVTQAWADSSEGDYGGPHCPKCGNEATEGEHKSEDTGNGVRCWTEHPEHTEEYEVLPGDCTYRCDACKILFGGDEAFGDDPLGFYLDDEEYKAWQGGDDTDISIMKSPYYTYGPFCSPCAPGAVYLRNGAEEGDAKAYCFAPDWFDVLDGNPAGHYNGQPTSCLYPVFRVADDVCIYTPDKKAEDE